MKRKKKYEIINEQLSLQDQSKSTISNEFQDPSSFLLPNSYHITSNHHFRYLRDLFLEQQKLFVEATEMIPKIEAAIIPVQHDLAILQIKETI